MNRDQAIRAKIEELYCLRPWAGVVPIQEAIAEAWSYRLGLDEQERQSFDEQIEMDIHPAIAMETMERLAGRVPSRMERSHIDVPIARAG